MYFIVITSITFFKIQMRTCSFWYFVNTFYKSFNSMVLWKSGVMVGWLGIWMNRLMVGWLGIWMNRLIGGIEYFIYFMYIK